MTTNDFDQWVLEVDALCLKHLACKWEDLCGELQPLQDHFRVGKSPMEQVPVRTLTRQERRWPRQPTPDRSAFD